MNAPAAPAAPVLVLALGNDLLGDDAAGWEALRLLRGDEWEGVDLVETCEGGFALLERLWGYRRAIVIDSIQTGLQPPGSLIDAAVEQLGAPIAPDPHYCGLPEVLALARELDLPRPETIRLVAVEIEPPTVFRRGLSPTIAAAVPALADRVRAILRAWGCRSRSAGEPARR